MKKVKEYIKYLIILIRENIMIEKSNKNTKILEDEEFSKIATFIENKVGIKMPISKKLMLQSRLQKRLKALSLPSFTTYVDYVFSSDLTGEEEIVLLIDAITTNLTHFYREPNHFTYLTTDAIPYLLKSGINHFNIWSAGCSSGEEPYSLAITMEEYKKNNPNVCFDYSIFASDISTNVLQKAKEAVYTIDSVKNLPLGLEEKYFIKCDNSGKKEIKIKNEICQKVKFQRLNFMDEDYCLENSMNIIFCRNVLMYFDKTTQETVIQKFMKHLQKGGYLFLGHSENIFNMNLPLKNVALTVFQKI